MPLRAQNLPADLGPILRSADDPAFVGTWWGVDDPLGGLTVYRHEPDGAVFRLHGSLEAARYTVSGDSVRFEGGYGDLVSPEQRTFGFRIVGDSLWLGRDDLAALRVGLGPGTGDPLEGRWMYARHGRVFMTEYTPDRRLIRWMILSSRNHL